MAKFLITGATRGIGRALVDRLAPDHDLLALGRDPAALAELPASAVVADLDHPSSLEAAVSGIEALDGVVHCAGTAGLGTVESTSLADWQSQFTVNVFAAAELTRLLLPALRSSRGRVVFVNSGQGQRVAPGWMPYAASKFALRALADGLRLEEPSLRVTSVYPGRVATDMQRGVRAHEGGAYDEDAYLQPSTVAAAIASVLTMPMDGVVEELMIRPS